MTENELKAMRACERVKNVAAYLRGQGDEWHAVQLREAGELLAELYPEHVPQPTFLEALRERRLRREQDARVGELEQLTATLSRELRRLRGVLETIGEHAQDEDIVALVAGALEEPPSQEHQA